MKPKINARTGEVFIKPFLFSLIERPEIPDPALDFFEKQNNRFINLDENKPQDFEYYGKVNYMTGDVTYFAHQTKTYSKTDNTVEKLTYFYDMRGDGTFIGSGGIGYVAHTEGVYLHEPYVEQIETCEPYRRRGYATRRLHVMNAYAKAAYNVPLCSGYLFTSNNEYSVEPGREVWKQLFKKGIAKKIQDGPWIVFSFR